MNCAGFRKILLANVLKIAVCVTESVAMTPRDDGGDKHT